MVREPPMKGRGPPRRRLAAPTIQRWPTMAPATAAAVDYGCKRSILLAGSPAPAPVSSVYPHDADADDAAAGTTASLLSKGPGDPAPLAARSQSVGSCSAESPSWDLPRAPAARARDRPAHVQAAVRAPRRQPPVLERRHRAGPRHEPEPRLRGRRRPRDGLARRRTSRSTTAPSRGSTSRLSAPLRPVPPRGRARAARRAADPRATASRTRRRCRVDGI